MQKILFIHYGVFEKDRWGRTFPLAKAAHRCGLKVTLLTTDSQRGLFPRKIHLEGVNILAFPDLLPYSLLRRGYGLISFFLRLFYALIYRFDYTYIDCGETPNAGWPGKVSQFRGATLLSEWGDLLGKGGYYDRKPTLFKLLYGWYYLWAEVYFRKSADFVIVLSTMMQKHAIKIGIKQSHLQLVPGGTIPDVIHYGYASKNTLGIDDSIITLGYIGIDEAELKDLIPLIKVLKKSSFRDRFKLILFGEKLSYTLLEQYGIEKIALSYGWVNYYKDYSALQAIDIFVLLKSTNIEIDEMGWPNKLGDYLTIGRPIIISPYGDIASFINQYPTGFIQINKPIEEHINKVLTFILEERYPIYEMGKYNRNLAEQTISWDSRMLLLLKNIQSN